jgi:hypothetical protein
VTEGTAEDGSKMSGVAEKEMETMVTSVLKL